MKTFLKKGNSTKEYSDYRDEAAEIFKRLDNDFYNLTHEDRMFNKQVWSSKKFKCIMDAGCGKVGFKFPIGLQFKDLLPVRPYTFPC